MKCFLHILAISCFIPLFGCQSDLKQAATQNGDAKAQYRLGVKYENGIGVTRNPIEALRWFYRSAEQEYPDALYRLGVKHFSGNDVPLNFKAAIRWWRRAAAVGHVGAIKRLELTSSFNDAKQSARAGGAAAQYKLGFLYQEGLGVLVDESLAVEWFKLAAEQGHTEAQFNLGYKYLRGKGIDQDKKRAIAWWLRAAGQGHRSAQFNLALAYAAGDGVQKDSMKSQFWYQRAGRNGSANAWLLLGFQRYLDLTLRPVYIPAHNWVMVARTGNKHR